MQADGFRIHRLHHIQFYFRALPGIYLRLDGGHHPARLPALAEQDYFCPAVRSGIDMQAVIGVLPALVGKTVHIRFAAVCMFRNRQKLGIPCHICLRRLIHRLAHPGCDFIPIRLLCHPQLLILCLPCFCHTLFYRYTAVDPRHPNHGFIHFQPVPGLCRKPVDCDRLILFCHKLLLYPMLPFISRSIRLFISTAYSNGSSFDTLLAKPLTIIDRASSSLMPRDIR